MYLEPLAVVLDNVFCPTGSGGGVDATCPPGGKEAGTAGRRSGETPDAYGDRVIRATTPLTPNEVKAQDAYRQSGLFYKMQNLSRGSGGFLSRLLGPSAETKQAVANLDSAIGKSHSTEDMEVYRGMQFSGTVDPNKLPGFKNGTIHDDGFCSTSLDKGVADRFARCVVLPCTTATLRIKIPKGSSCLKMSRVEGKFDEAEVLMGRGSEYRVTGVRKLPGGISGMDRYEIEAEYVGTSRKALKLPAANSLDAVLSANADVALHAGRRDWPADRFVWHPGDWTAGSGGATTAVVSQTANVFCPTGPGGGVDPTCPRTGGTAHPPVGGTFTKYHHGIAHDIEVTPTGYKHLQSGHTFPTMTQLAKFVKGSPVAVNGWKFFGVDKPGPGVLPDTHPSAGGTAAAGIFGKPGKAAPPAPASTPAPTPAPSPPPPLPPPAPPDPAAGFTVPGGLPHPAALTFVKDLPGSTSPKLMKAANGTLWKQKTATAGKEDRLRNEADANAAYRAANVLAPKAGIVETPSGPLMLSKWTEGQTLSTWKAGKSASEIAAVHKAIGKNFAADCLLANWDVIGTGGGGGDNVLVDQYGVPWRIDNGGALKYRAQGSPKGSKFGPTVGELDTLRSPAYNAAAAAVFGHLSDADVKHQVEDLLPKKSQVLAAVKDPATRDILAQRFDYLDNWAKAPATAAPAVTGVSAHTPPPLPPPLPPPSSVIGPAPAAAPVHTGVPAHAGPLHDPSHGIKVHKPKVSLAGSAVDAASLLGTIQYTASGLPISGAGLHNLHTAKGLAAHVEANQGTASFTPTDLKKIEHFNPNGLDDGSITVGKIFQNKATKDKEKAKTTGKHLQTEQVKVLQDLLPGMTIKIAHTTKEKMTIKGGAGMMATFTPAKVGAAHAALPPGTLKYFTNIEPSPSGGFTAAAKQGPMYDEHAHSSWMVHLSGAEHTAVSDWKADCGPTRKNIMDHKTAGAALTHQSKTFLAAIAKAKDHAGFVYRGIGTKNNWGDKVAEMCETEGVGGTYTDPMPHCTSLNCYKASNFANGSTMLRIACKTAKPIHKEDGHVSEMECVGQGGTVYEIRGVHHDVNLNMAMPHGGTHMEHFNHVIDLVEKDK
jgi:hypothetical protein